MLDEIIKRLELNLEVAKEENPQIPLYEQLNLAREWTTNELASIVSRLATQRWERNVDAVNKIFYG